MTTTNTAALSPRLAGIAAAVLACTEAADLPTAENAVAQLRCLYRSAVNYGAEWFVADDHSGWDAWGTVRFYAACVPAAKAAQIIAAFEALAA